MAPRVEQHVGDRVPHLAGRAQDVEVEAVGQDGAAEPERSVHGSREPGAERLHPIREIARSRGLDDRVHVVALDRVVRDAETTALARLAKRLLELDHEAPRAERRKTASDPQRDVARMRTLECGALAMRIATDRAGLAAGAGATPSPARSGRKIENELADPACHELHHDTHA